MTPFIVRKKNNESLMSSGKRIDTAKEMENEKD
jgi:hypothetical protein